MGKSNILKGLVVLTVGVLLGWLIFGGKTDADPIDEHAEHNHENQVEIWTCSMHPQIRQNKPGDCPICGMDLIPAEQGSTDPTLDLNAIQMTEDAIKLAEIETIKIVKQNPVKEIRMFGKIKPDERRMYSQTAHVTGRIEKLYINYTGEKIHKGQKIAAVYSPQLITAQKELFEMLKAPDVNPRLLEAARNKLKLWKFTDAQIKELEDKGEIQTEIEILSDYSGYVFERKVALGDHVMEGQLLLHVIDLNNVWVMLEAYETDLSWLNKGDEVQLEIEAYPGEYQFAKIDFIDPFINSKTRVAQVRLNLLNKNAQYKPEMFVNAIVEAKLPLDEPTLLVPKSAVLWTGKRSIVYIEIPNKEKPTFLMKEVTLGPSTGDMYVVKKGIIENVRVVTNGVFKIDAAAQLKGKKSMMNPDTGKEVTGHNH